MNTLKNKGRLAGGLYFAMAILTGGGYFLKTRIVNPADAAGTVAGLLADRAGALASVAANLAGQTVSCSWVSCFSTSLRPSTWRSTPPRRLIGASASTARSRSARGRLDRF
ncbi:MAG: hypothetical protein ACLQMF_06915 [Rectinemataceae bacterium]